MLYYPVERYLAHYTDVLITMNKEDYKRAQKFKARKIEYVPGVGIDTKKFIDCNINRDVKLAELGVTTDSIVLVSIGELIKRKNHEVVIRALAKLKDPRIKYLICGQGELHQYLNNLVDELHIRKQVKFLGYRKDIPELLKASDIFVFPSFQEGLSVALMEAMAASLPVVCSNIRGNTDLIEDGKGGLLVKRNDIDDYVNVIEEAINNYENIKISKHNINKIKNYDIRIINEKMKTIYTSIE